MKQSAAPTETQGIAVGQIWRAPDGRLLRVVGVESGKPVAVRNVETNRLNYQPLSYFDSAQKWHLVLQPPETPQEDAAPPVDLEPIKTVLAEMRAFCRAHSGHAAEPTVFKLAQHLTAAIRASAASVTARPTSPDVVSNRVAPSGEDSGQPPSLLAAPPVDLTQIAEDIASQRENYGLDNYVELITTAMQDVFQRGATSSQPLLAASEGRVRETLEHARTFCLDVRTAGDASGSRIRYNAIALTDELEAALAPLAEPPKETMK